jgi:NAD(P)-dependent dehydrogenase (short-subunit alcohol dehydrogenase family)
VGLCARLIAVRTEADSNQREKHTVDSLALNENSILHLKWKRLKPSSKTTPNKTRRSNLYSDLKGKTAIITGSGKRSGIGYAMAEKLAACGSNVIIADLGANSEETSGVKSATRNEMENITESLKDNYGIKTLAVDLDVMSTESIARMIQTIKSQFERVDLLFNNAGAVFGAPNTVHDYDEGAWIKTVDINLHGVFRVSKAVIPLMLGKPGAIVNVASRAGKSPPLWNPAYAVAKAGVIMLTKVMAKDLAIQDIRVNAICPGLIMTDLQQFRIQKEAEVFGMSYDEAKERLAKTVPMERLGHPSEVADLAVYLASEQSSYITGQAMNIGGGALMEV